MSKYASLPDIDTGADVFETPDVPPEISYSLDSDSDDEFRLARAGSPTAALRRAHAGTSKQQQQEDSENIDAEHLDAGEARKRFGAASRASLNNWNGRDASSLRPPVRRPLPSATVYTAGEDPDERDKETPLERLRRLRLEVTELEEEVRRTELDPGAAAAARNASLEVTAADEEGKDSTAIKTKQKKREVSPAVLLQQVQLLRNDLQGISPKVEGVLEADGELASSPDAAAATLGGRLTQQKASATSHLLKKLDSAAEEDRPGTAADQPREVGRTGAAESGSPRDKNDADLDKRVSAMEAILGANEADVDEVHAVPSSLLQTTTRLDHLLTLLAQPRHLDSISRRVKVLVSDLERIHDSRRKLGDTRPLNVALSGGMTLSTVPPEGGAASSTPSLAAAASSSTARGDGPPTTSLPPDALQKIDALFTLLPRIDPLVPLAPRLVARLRSLANLHASAAQFGEALAALKGQVAELDEGEQGLREVVQGLEKSFGENEERVKGNLEAMDKRVEEVLKRLDRLAA